MMKTALSMNLNNKHILLLFYNRRHNPLIIKKIKECYDCKITCLDINLGEKRETSQIKKEALHAGADEFISHNATNEFCENIITKAIKASAVYQDKYYLSAALARPFLSIIAVRFLKKLGADIIMHGYRGNDQIRMDMAVDTLGEKSIPILSYYQLPETEISAYLQQNDIPNEFGTNNPYSTSENIWGRSIECGDLENPMQPSKENIYKIAKLSEQKKTRLISIDFKAGVPVALNKHPTSLVNIILELNQLAGELGIGIFDTIEDGIVGIKSRAIYENPAAYCLIEAHKDLERFILNRHLNYFKNTIDHKWAEMVYAGFWFDPLMECLNAFIDKSNQLVTGTVVLRLSSGQAFICGRESKYSVYSKDMAIYNMGHLAFNHDIESFSKIFNLHTKWGYKKIIK